MSKIFVILFFLGYTICMIQINQEIYQKLKIVGFNSAEQQVIFYLFQNGASTIANIAKHVKLPRTTIHLAVENLLKQDIIQSSQSGKRRVVYIEKPEKIRKIIEHEQKEVNKRQEILESVLPNLRTLFSLRGEGERIDIEHFEGESGFVETFWRSLDQKKGSEILRIAGDVETFTVARQHLKEYGVKRRKKKIFARHIITESPLADDELREAPLKQRDVRVISKNLIDPKVHIALWENHVCFTVWDTKLHSIIITNPSIYSFMKSVFEILWIQGRK